MNIIEQIKQMPENQLLGLGGIVIGVVLILIAVVLML